MDEKLIKKMQKLLLKIPEGKVTSYKEIAKQLRVHPRFAGRIVGSNPDGDTYPCYRVVYSNGRVGGFGGNVPEKIRRLKKDGIEIKNGKISKKFFFYF
jgi:O6-methylguanine-DNA--protein-cysteine methyltransferase